MTRTSRLLLASVFTFALAMPCPAQAQNPTPAGTEGLSASGTIEEILSDQMVRVKVSDTESWMLEVKPESKVEVTGSAESGYLRAGLTIRFEGAFDAKGVLESEITELELFTPQVKTGLGLFSDKSSTKPIPKAPAGKYDIRAKVVTLNGKDITLLAGQKKLSGTVSPDVSISLVSDDFTYVQPGDPVKVVGYFLPANKAAAQKQGQAVADELTIALPKPLAAAAKKTAKAKPAKTPKASREAREAKANDDAPMIQDPFGVDNKAGQ